MAAEDCGSENWVSNVLITQDQMGVMDKGTVERRPCGPKDVKIEITHSGICHSDLHQLRAEWPIPNRYPMVAGHEGAGVVVEVGSEVTNFELGDHVGVGCMVDSCRECDCCDKKLEQYCAEGNTPTYNGLARAEKVTIKNCEAGELTFGTYTDGMVVDERFVFKVDKSIPLEVTGPLLCAGVTTWDPLVHWGAKDAGENFTVGIIGFGGLGHMGLKWGKAFGNNTYALSRSERKRPWAAELGVGYINYSNEEERKNAPKFNLILDTVSGNHDINPFISGMLTLDGTLVVLGVPKEPFQIHAFSLIMGRKRVAGSLIGGTQSTQEMLEYVAEVGESVYPMVHVIHPSQVNDAMEQLATGTNPKARFVIDCSKMKEDYETEKVEHTPYEQHAYATVIIG